MRYVEGYWFPDYDRHFETEMGRTPEREYQKDRRELALSFVEHFGLAVDVGAHVGLWSRQLAATFERVVAFEPTAELRRCFVKNVDMAKVELHGFALGAVPGEIRLGRTDTANSGSYTADGGLGDLVPVRTLDSLGLPRCDFIKVDVQGMEREVLLGARTTIEAFGPVLCIEQTKPDFSAYEFARTELGYTLRARKGKEHIMTRRSGRWRWFFPSLSLRRLRP